MKKGGDGHRRTSSKRWARRERNRNLAGAGRRAGVADGSRWDWGTGLSHTAHLCGFHLCWRPAVRVKTSSPTPPGRIRSPAKTYFACWPRRWVPASAWCIHPPPLGFALTRLVCPLMRDVVLIRDEIDGLVAGLLTMVDWRLLFSHSVEIVPDASSQSRISFRRVTPELYTWLQMVYIFWIYY